MFSRQIALTHFPISLLTGFMIKEERKPLRYMTNGIVAMNFCRSKKKEPNEEMLTNVI